MAERVASSSDGAGLKAGLEVPNNDAGGSDSGDSEGRQLDPDSGEEPDSPPRMDGALADWTKEVLCRALKERVERYG